jgi:hypothetical protein
MTPEHGDDEGPGKERRDVGQGGERSSRHRISVVVRKRAEPACDQRHGRDCRQATRRRRRC